jgi:hypothetical protein
VSITLAAREDLRRFAAISSGALGRRVTMAEALRIAIELATARIDAEGQDAAIKLGLIDPPKTEGKRK